ncbi:hypothetical protein Scep_003656 [Stephania cephalantha]|uniref:Uncharacterized protein n=1 Tax=Stephania cephalantha TaxID=152367 RepID=A0AAP0KSW1_9MAGN
MGTDVETPPLSQPILTSNNPLSPSSNLYLKTLPASRQLSVSLSLSIYRPIHRQLSVSLSRPIHRLPKVVPSAVRSGRRGVVAAASRSHRRPLRLSPRSLLLSPAVAALSRVVRRSEIIAIGWALAAIAVRPAIVAALRHCSETIASAAALTVVSPALSRSSPPLGNHRHWLGPSRACCIIRHSSRCFVAALGNYRRWLGLLRFSRNQPSLLRRSSSSLPKTIALVGLFSAASCSSLSQLVAILRHCRRKPSPHWLAFACIAGSFRHRRRSSSARKPSLVGPSLPLLASFAIVAAACRRSPSETITIGHCWSLKRTYKVWNASLEWPRAGIGYELRAFETNTSETPPTVNEMYLHLHTVNHDGVTFIDTRSEQFYAKLQRRRLELTQATLDQPVDDEAVYFNVAGECHKGRVYGLGSLGRMKRRYADPGASTSQMPEMVPRSEFNSVAEQLRQVVAFMQ